MTGGIQCTAFGVVHWIRRRYFFHRWRRDHYWFPSPRSVECCTGSLSCSSRRPSHDEFRSLGARHRSRSGDLSQVLRGDLSHFSSRGFFSSRNLVAWLVMSVSFFWSFLPFIPRRFRFAILKGLFDASRSGVSRLTRLLPVW